MKRKMKTVTCSLKTNKEMITRALQNRLKGWRARCTTERVGGATATPPRLPTTATATAGPSYAAYAITQQPPPFFSSGASLKSFPSVSPLPIRAPPTILGLAPFFGSCLAA